jgi:hypothetical protein
MRTNVFRLNNVDHVTLSLFSRKSRNLRGVGSQAHFPCSPLSLLVVQTSGDYLYVYVYQRKTPKTPKWYAYTVISKCLARLRRSEPETMCWAIWRECHRVDPIRVSSEKACQSLYGMVKDVINIVAQTVMTWLEENKKFARIE